MSVPYVFNVQRFSINDGPGLRTTVFFKGCPLSCPWCHNPESISFEPEVMVSADGGAEVVGRQYPVAELVELCAKDQIFYDQSGGGVTLSGGEVMVQDFGYVTELVESLRAKGITVGIDTCGLAPSERFTALANRAAFFLYDLKFIDSEKHRQYCGAPNDLILKNLKLLADAGANLYLRLILLEGLNTDSQTIESTLNWLVEHEIRPTEVNLLPYHRFGQDKAVKLGRPWREFVTPSDETVNRYKERLESVFTQVTIGG
ncbi:MAG: radical SAM protein [Propionibacteriaceae bacterium]|jgi:pyruvate formate lyase activating enzyme|nr:radical SAM protein [Propionibacteriaceae bacterium]